MAIFTQRAYPLVKLSVATETQWFYINNNVLRIGLITPLI